MDVDQKVLVPQVFECIVYADLVIEYYREYSVTTEIQIDSLVILYRFTRSERIFNIIFLTHKRLLDKIAYSTFYKYKRHLYEDDLDELKSMVYAEFYNRVMAYKIPPDAPFSKYVKLYISKWLNAYTKLMVKKRDRVVLGHNYER